MMHKTITIIGAGPAGYVSAIKAAQTGYKVNIIEKKSCGGTCLNIGCIPTKAILYPLSFLNRNYNRMGIITNKMTVDLEKLNSWKTAAVKKAVRGVEFLFKKYENIRLIKGEAELISKNKVKIGEEILESDYIILAMGSEPFVPKIFNIEGIWTSDDALALNNIPESLTIIGAGVIGVEIGFIYSKLGSKVTLVDVLDHVGGLWIDKEISEELESILRSQGISIMLQKKVKQLESHKVILENGECIDSQKIMLAMGRRSIIPKWLNDNGIEIARNKVVTDKNCETNVKNIFAIGDLIDGPMLAHKAMHDGIRVIKYLDGETNTEYPIPSVIYTHPEVASIGMTESEAKEQLGDEVKISKFPYSANARANCTKELKGFVKIITFEDEIKGVHIIGENSSEMIWGFGTIIGKKYKAKDLENLVFPHPSFSESIHEAILGIDGEFIHL